MALWYVGIKFLHECDRVYFREIKTIFKAFCLFFLSRLDLKDVVPEMGILNERVLTGSTKVVRYICKRFLLPPIHLNGEKGILTKIVGLAKYMTPTWP